MAQSQHGREQVQSQYGTQKISLIQKETQRTGCEFLCEGEENCGIMGDVFVKQQAPLMKLYLTGLEQKS